MATKKQTSMMMAALLLAPATTLHAQAKMPMGDMAKPAMAMPKIGDPALPTAAFLKEAAQSDRFEIEEGRLAAKMGKDPKVRAFGTKMVHDHMQSTAMIKAAVTKAGMTPPPPPPLKPEQQKMISATTGMASMGGFDADYVNDQVMAHEAALALLTNYAKSGATPAVRDAAAKIVPTVRMHLTMVKDMQKTMPKTAGMKTSAM